MKSRAIMGGTFDPIHNGHLHVAMAAKEAFNLKQVVFVPTGSQALKHKTEDNKHHRLKMTELAVSIYEDFIVSDIEIQKEGTSYTVDTLEALAFQGKPYFILGADALSNIFMWKDHLRLFKLCEFILVNRPKAPILQDMIKVMELQGAVVHLLTIPDFDLSATNIRYRVNTNKPIDHLVPGSVAEYISKNGLYKEDIPFNFQSASDTQKQNLTRERYQHVLGVCGEAVSLAKQYKQCSHRAHIAAMLHDWTKEYTDEENEAAFLKYNYTPDPFMQQELSLCHGFLAAEIAKKDFGIQCEDTLNAIRYHTTGRPQMTMLEKVVFIADAIEPTRGNSEYMQNLRNEAYQNIDKAMYTCLSHNLNKAVKNGYIYHPLGLNALEEYKKRC